MILLIQLSHCGFVALFFVISMSSFASFPVAFLVWSVWRSCSSSSCVMPGPFVPFGSCWMWYVLCGSRARLQPL